MEGYANAYLGLHIAYLRRLGTRLRAGRTSDAAQSQSSRLVLAAAWSINAYRQRDGQRALDIALKINMPGLWTAQVALAVVNSQLGEMDAGPHGSTSAAGARPNFAANVRGELAKWWQPDMVEQIIGDLRKAGLDDAGL